MFTSKPTTAIAMAVPNCTSFGWNKRTTDSAPTARQQAQDQRRGKPTQVTNLPSTKTET